MKDRSLLTIKAFLAVDLMIGFYVLAIGMAVVLPLAFSVYGLIGTILILISLWPRRDRFRAPGPALESSQHPRLFETLEGIARSLGEEMPSAVYLTDEMNAWVAQRGGRAGFGGQRVMGLGLPLLQSLTVSELRGVLAHEFGHFHGGETKLGPWIYRTRSAMSETIGTLRSGAGGIPFRIVHVILVLVSLIFWIYALAFLRLTRSIGRQQELDADQLAAGLVGRETMASALRTLVECSTAFRRFVKNELLGIVAAGYRPSVFEGFARYRKAGAVTDTVSDRRDEELAAPRTSPYDTHPSLRDRLAALEGRSSADGESSEEEDEEALAITLLEDASVFEPILLAAVTQQPVQALRALAPLDWDELGARFVLPKWETVVREQAAALAGITPEQLPDHAQDPAEVGKRFGKGGTKIINADAARRAALATLGAALGVALVRAGWSLEAQPGEKPVVVNGGTRIDPFTVLPRLNEGALTAMAWRKQCGSAGVSSVDLGTLAPAKPAPPPHAEPQPKARPLIKRKRRDEDGG